MASRHELPQYILKAPVTRSLLIITGAMFVCVHFLFKKSPDFFLLSTQALRGKKQLWKLLLQSFFPYSMGDMLFLTLLLYQFRRLEVHLSSRKFAMTSVLITGIAMAMQIAYLFIMGDKTKVLATGPFALVFGLLVFYCFDIPSASMIPIVRGVGVGADKLFTYIIAFQMFFSSTPGATLAASTGVLASLLFVRHPHLPLHRWAFSRQWAQMFHQTVGPLIGFASPPAPAPATGAGDVAATGAGDVVGAGAEEEEGEGGGGGGGRRRRRPEEEAAEAVQQQGGGIRSPDPDPLLITQLVAMGFSEASVRRALSETSNQIELAMNQLLSSSDRIMGHHPHQHQQ